MYCVFRSGALALVLFYGWGASAQSSVASPSTRQAPELTRASALQMTTGELARLLMPGVPAGRFDSHEVGRLGPHGEPLMNIDFFQQPVPIGTDLCRRDVTSALFQPDGVWEAGRDSPVRFTRTAVKVQMAVAPRCRLKAGGYFGWVQPEGVDELAPHALRRLASLQAAAKAKGELPVKLACESEHDPKDCDRGANALLADLPLDRIFIIQPHASRWGFSVMPDGPGKAYWHVTIPPEAVNKEPLVMRWGLPAPF